SRRRHTRFDCDWSSDVCSSDLAAAELPAWPILRRLPPDAAGALTVLIGTRRGALARVIAGAGCVATGVVAFVITADSWSALRGEIGRASWREGWGGRGGEERGE